MPNKYYSVFGLIIESEMDFVHIPAIDFKANTQTDFTDFTDFKVDVKIQSGQLSKNFNIPNQSGLFKIEDSFILRLKNIADICITQKINYLNKLNYFEIIVQPYTDDWAHIHLFILGSAMGIILHLKNYLVIHGNAVVNPETNKAWIFAGDSGVGKSTLAACFHKAGFGLLSDDVSAIKFNLDQNQAVVYPAFGQIKLWNDALDRINIDSDFNHPKIPIYNRQNKFAVPLASAFCESPKVIEKIILLEKSEKFKTLSLHKIKGSEALISIQKNVYRLHYLKILGLLKSNFTDCARLASCVDVYTIKRPNNGFFSRQIMECFGVNNA